MTNQEKAIYIKNRHILYDLGLIKGYTSTNERSVKQVKLRVPFSSCHHTVDDYNRDVHTIFECAGEYKTISEDIIQRVRQTRIEFGELA